MSDTPRNIRLLIVDDEKGFTEVLAKRMTRRGIAATTASSGEEAVRLLRGEDFDIAILDLKLEGMDGVEILKIFRLLDPELPVLMLTGHGSESAVKASMRLGAADYLSKPIDFEVLMAKVLRFARSGGSQS
ncbi:MAG: response regulator [Pseudodesulfovibrio sp.]|uniref:Response regulator receiver n=1 Tax=Pseudodesulfovibrio aespoeensis (strain ATCC 700646 / DSM 10631 / Aspo-2) TaxID=643562 RepID=E6VSN9_PSEA9|nr:MULTISPECIES: response regulator [Pseudodesulfovibrio]MBU4378931.1 response regulator [Pseudomonadota bacterium]ADU62024.1 response regulator receiver [Pseudodesulfovibrio aespoeensis Aspo-2]MBU4474667.1 response regulator [Pseudomonadota bacterium]MBU4516006.1 response regulator [Pseudomonadota bacterium]MBU4522792.1 response regulator [Pseudomonadota bacterium]